MIMIIRIIIIGFICLCSYYYLVVSSDCFDFRDSDEDFIDPIKAAANVDDDPVSSLPAAPPKQKKSKAKKKGKKRFAFIIILKLLSSDLILIGAQHFV